MYENQKEYSKSIDLCLQIWKDHADLNTYKEIKRLADILGSWSDLKRGLVQGLEKQNSFDLLTEIFLYEKDWKTAWDYADKIQRSWMSYSDIRLRLADTSEKDCPHKAIKIYYEYAERLINRRGRGNYSEASSYLKKMLKIFSRIEEKKQGKEIISDIRIKYNKLPALQDEMNQVGL